MPRLLVVDNHDSFTFTLVDYLLTLGAEVDVAESDNIGLADALCRPVDGIVLAPGPGRPEDAGISVALAEACIAERRPLLGVCLGHQAIALACGASVVRTPPVHGKSVELRHDGSGLFRELPPSFKVTRYNSLSVADLPPELAANAWDEAGIQALRHRQAPVHGVQFHPESVTSEHGHALLDAFIQECC
ncbi:MAG TPA: aminodeoxychorismate/anthranilate synthase component II [Sphingomicrobium sp.]|jgi:anthranilate synthase/aminodeoxychorismate synthase-like glutamine amidotransferase|nr:aminodeoxychorismate/anthranilate synthase component II [Sphingomicrobium sp.]